MKNSLLLLLMFTLACDSKQPGLFTRTNPQIDEHREMPGQRPNFEMTIGTQPSSMGSRCFDDGSNKCDLLKALSDEISSFFADDPNDTPHRDDSDITAYPPPSLENYGSQIYWTEGRPSKQPPYFDLERLEEIEKSNREIMGQWDQDKAALSRRDLLGKSYQQKISEFQSLRALDTPSVTYPSALSDLASSSASSHNTATDEILDSFPTARETSFPQHPEFATDANTVEGKQVRTAYNYANYVENQVKSNPNPTSKALGQQLVAGAKTGIGIADKNFAEGNFDEAQFALDIATNLLDVGLSLTPGIGWAKDVYEACTGTNMLTGEELSDWERGFAVLGVVTVGIGSKLGKTSKTLEIFGDIVKAADNGEDATKAVKSAEKIIVTSEKVGLKTVEDVKKFGEVSTKYGRSSEAAAESLQNGKGIFGNAAKVEREALSQNQVSNLKRFEDKLPAGSNPVTIHQEGSNVIFKGEVPGRVSGSKAVYEKVVDQNGNTLSYTKTTYAPDGKVVHIKDKIDGSVITPEELP